VQRRKKRRFSLDNSYVWFSALYIGFKLRAPEIFSVYNSYKDSLTRRRLKVNVTRLRGLRTEVVGIKIRLYLVLLIGKNGGILVD